MKKLIIISFLSFYVFILLTSIINSERILKYEHNPNCTIKECKDNEENTHIVCIKSYDPEFKNESTYYNIWIFTNYYSPTILLFETSYDSYLKIDWTKFFDQSSNFDSIKFDGHVLNSFGIELTDLFLVNITTKQLLDNIDIHHSNWTMQLLNNNSNEIDAKFSNHNPNIGIINFYLKSSAKNGRQIILPKLIYTNSGNLLRMEIEQMTLNQTLKQNNTRLQLSANFTTIINGNIDVKSNIDKFTGIDDEYTPGVFQRYLYEMNAIHNNVTRSSFIDWKPVAYFDHKQQIATSLKVINPIMKNVTLSKTSKSALTTYFNPNESYAIQLSNFRFNSDDDTEFDLSLNDTTIEFSLSLSLTSMNVPQFSSTMTIVIVAVLIGLGTPFILLLIFIMYSFSKRILSAANYDLQNDDLENVS